MGSGNLFFGWFDDASQVTPSYDPPRNAPCLFCGARINATDVRTHSLMYRGEYAARSYFYRTHRTCADRDGGANSMDGFILDMIARIGD
jgi:hypothetical protein